ncbi:protein PHYTOCHROME KINASE SUBSTRATE 1-like [Cynara cardunculus var. scolymus]|uniref:protein PHYTOCHROME KINASE SUBSTRATE 1-like n=1 Tax=Cynara cardunculus var. scolymus TaxID=59895 RepID=UPI000D6231A5|nr:protein PHYTOCHROME KINASE SUBSTRATE 1-like [Cynara cardunculus var. scolymus]
MEIYTSASSFETSLTLQPRNSFRDVSFSSYLNNAEENMIRKLTNQSSDTPKDHHHYPNPKKSEEEEEDDEEISVFGAEKYFKGEIEDGDGKNNRRFLDTSNSAIKIHHQDQRIEEFDHSFPVKQRTDQISMHTPSVRSNASLNSRSGLLPHTKQAPGKIEKESKTKILLSRFGCNCINKKSTQISEKRFIQTKEISKPPHPKILDFDQRTDPLSSKSAEKNTRNDYFSFPVLNANDTNSISNSNSKSENLAGKVHIDNNGGRLSLGRKLSLLNDWDVDIPTEDDMCIPSRLMYNNDIDSDSSSDLFEIESFSTTGNSSFLAHRTSESNCYAPSEVSIDWSIVTASAADFSVVSDYEEMRTGGGGWRNSGGKVQGMDHKDEQKKRPGILSGCTNQKAVRVAGDECKVSGGGAGGRRRSPESMAVGSMFRGVKSVTRFDRNYGSDVCPMSESKGRHASHHLYI